MKITTKDLALIPIFASLHAVLSLLPFTITLGVQGQITLGIIGGPLIGILLGPFIGGSAVLLGSFISVYLNPLGAIFGPLSVITPTMGAFCTGCVKIKRGYFSGAAILASLLIFYAYPSGREAYLFTWLHIAAMIVAFSPLASFASAGFSTSKPTRSRLALSVIMSVFVGILADHISGCAIAIWYFWYTLGIDLTAEFWYTLIYVYPIERLVAIALTSVIAIPVYYALKNAGLIN